VNALVAPTPWEVPAPFALGAATITFAPITPAAKSLIQAAMRRISAESSRRRFFTVRRQLSDRELAQFTELDGWDRYAIGALAHAPGVPVEGIGVARFARLAGRADEAEAAVIVVDAWQGRGIGKRLLRALASAAFARGIVRLRGVVLPDNQPMLELLSRHAPGLSRADAGELVDVAVRLDGTEDGRRS
jgi:GNAT superfamily N-acetyltransferase